VFNAIGLLTTQDQQVACFANAAAHLDPGGHFLIEVGVPDLRRLPPGENARVFAHAPGMWLTTATPTWSLSRPMSHHFAAAGSGVREHSTPFRYVWPSELDLMAKLAGMSLRDRWAGWDRSPLPVTVRRTSRCGRRTTFRANAVCSRMASPVGNTERRMGSPSVCQAESA